MNRNYIEYGDGGVITAQGKYDVSWSEVRQERDYELSRTDMWMLVDKYNTLTSEQQTEISNYRQALRDLGSQPDANTAVDNWPTKPSWL